MSAQELLLRKCHIIVPPKKNWLQIFATGTTKNISKQIQPTRSICNPGLRPMLNMGHIDVLRHTEMSSQFYRRFTMYLLQCSACVGRQMSWTFADNCNTVVTHTMSQIPREYSWQSLKGCTLAVVFRIPKFFDRQPEIQLFLLAELFLVAKHQVG